MRRTATLFLLLGALALSGCASDKKPGPAVGAPTGDASVAPTSPGDGATPGGPAGAIDACGLVTVAEVSAAMKTPAQQDDDASRVNDSFPGFRTTSCTWSNTDAQAGKIRIVTVQVTVRDPSRTAPPDLEDIKAYYDQTILPQKKADGPALGDASVITGLGTFVLKGDVLLNVGTGLAASQAGADAAVVELVPKAFARLP
jgi:hypothetical protein